MQVTPKIGLIMQWVAFKRRSLCDEKLFTVKSNIHTCQNFHHLDEKKFPEACCSSQCGISYAYFGGGVTFAVKVWSWMLYHILQFIGITRRDRRLNLLDSCNSRTSFGYAQGCPKLSGYPNLTYMGLNNVSEDTQCLIVQTGDFHMTCIIKVAYMATFS